MSEKSDVPSRSASLARRRKADGEPINGRSVPASPVLFESGNLPLLPNIQALVCRWLSEYHPPEVPISEES